MKLDDLVGLHILTGCQPGTMPKTSEWQDSDPNTLDFILDGKTISAVEEPDDGYRSSMEDLVENREGLVITNTFQPVFVLGTKRKDEDYMKNDVVDFIDCITGKVVLSIGTENTDDYYPCFVAEFTPENMWMNSKATH